MNVTPPLLLASGSPRRRGFLESVQIPFQVHVPEVDETPLPDEPPADMVQRLAREKARAVAAAFPRPAGLVLAADTDVVLDGEALHKPQDEQDARRILRRLSGRVHQVITGSCVLDQATGQERVALARTVVHFRELDDNDIEDSFDLENYLA